jgi:membrane-associated phospholipid phosphatase
MMATLVYGFIAVFVILRLATGWWQALIVFCTGMLVLTVVFSRMYLGAHYLSDVLGAMAAGVGWLAICLISVETWRRRRLMMVHRNPGRANIPLSTMQESKRSEAKGNGH